MGVSVKAPAKINLTLDVLQKREDGYHEVEMVMTTIDLADRIHLVPTDDGEISVQLSSSFIPIDERNLAYKAARLLQQEYGVKQGVSIYITKNIPVAAGLAGGSSNAAATLKGLNELWELHLSLDTLAKIGAKIGSDVAFCIYGKTAVATGRGEIIRPIASPPPCWVVLAKPPIGVSTQDVYKQLTPADFQRGHTEKMVRAIEAGNFQDICQSLHNTLEKVTLSQHPEVRMIKEQMLRFGASGVLMSGSGPTVFGLVEQESRVARIYNGLRGFCEDVFFVRLIR